MARLLLHLHKSNIRNHLNIISRSLYTNSTKYDNIVILSDFNKCVDEALRNFCKTSLFSNLINQFTCFKNPENPSCTDLTLTNKPCTLQTKFIIEARSQSDNLCPKNALLKDSSQIIIGILTL